MLGSGGLDPWQQPWCQAPAERCSWAQLCVLQRSGLQQKTTGSCFPEDIWNFSVISNFNLKDLHLQILIPPSYLLCSGDFISIKSFRGGNQRLFSANHSVCTGYISSRQMNLIVSTWDVELSTTLCFSQGLNYIILLGNLKANVIWRQRNEKKMSLAVPWGTHGMEGDTGESSWAMETLCLWIASRGAQPLWPT